MLGDYEQLGTRSIYIANGHPLGLKIVFVITEFYQNYAISKRSREAVFFETLECFCNNKVKNLA